jgi:hypothetical protein
MCINVCNGISSPSSSHGILPKIMSLNTKNQQHAPLNFGKAIIVLPGTEANEDQIGRFFQTFYNGLSREHRAWMPYIDEESRFPLLFNLADEALNRNNDLMMAIITPRTTQQIYSTVGRMPASLMNFITYRR